MILIILCNYLNRLIFQVISILLYAAANKQTKTTQKLIFDIFTYIYNYTFTCSRWVSVEMASGFRHQDTKSCSLANFVRGNLKACQSWWELLLRRSLACSHSARGLAFTRARVWWMLIKQITTVVRVTRGDKGGDPLLMFSTHSI